MVYIIFRMRNVENPFMACVVFLCLAQSVHNDLVGSQLLNAPETEKQKVKTVLIKSARLWFELKMEQQKFSNNINSRHPVEVLLFFSCKCYKQSKFLQRVFTLITLLANIVFVHILFEHLAFEMAEFKTVFGIYGGLVLIPFSIACIPNILAPRRILDILDTMYQIVSANELVLNMSNSEYNFHKTINRTLIQAVFSFFIAVALRWVETPFYSTNSLSGFVLSLDFYRHYLIVYMAYLIELVKHILGLSSVRMLDHSKARKLNEHQMIQALSKIRLIHLEIWEIVKQINGHFGWTFIAIFFESFINSSRSIYKVIVYFYADGSRHMVLRKYHTHSAYFIISRLHYCCE